MLLIIAVQKPGSLGEIIYNLEKPKEKRKFRKREVLTLVLVSSYAAICFTLRFVWYYVQFYHYNNNVPVNVEFAFYTALSFF